jgi:hypothetical protein
MKTALEIDISFEQVLSIVKQLSIEEKIRLSQEIEKETLGPRMTQLLSEFRTNELDETTIETEVEMVRKELYEKKIR